MATRKCSWIKHFDLRYLETIPQLVFAIEMVNVIHEEGVQRLFLPWGYKMKKVVFAS